MKNRIKKIAQLILASGSRKEEGVTLIELLAVIVILAIIAAVAVPVVLNSIQRSKVNSTKQSIATIASAINQYAADHDGTFPTTDTELTQNDTVNGQVFGPYLQSMPNDAWGNAITFNSTDNYTITSSGDGTNTISMNSSQSEPSVGK